LGKSTLVNSLFLTDLYKDRKLLNAEGKNCLKGTVHQKKKSFLFILSIQYTLLLKSLRSVRFFSPNKRILLFSKNAFN